MKLTIVSPDTYFVYACKEIEFYIFKMIKLRKTENTQYKLFIANVKTKNIYPKLSEKNQSKIAEKVIAKFQQLKKSSFKKIK